MAGEFITRRLADTVEDALSTYISNDDTLTMHHLDRFKCEHSHFLADNSKENVIPQTYSLTLPDGQSVHLDSKDLSNCTESVMTPPAGFSHQHMQSRDDVGLSEKIYHHVMNLPIDLRLNHLTEKIFLAGGVSLTMSCKQRLEQDIQNLYHAQTKKLVQVNIESVARPLEGAAEGAALLALTCPLKDPTSLDIHEDKFWITKALYNEHGADRLHHQFLH
eukprot:GHVH01002105.1.p1 GENE.GHVH01002105.1~~GHVH01002105.1.p1  ORF type:complete len:219 (+),score=32.06 GHVH01002105.1:592-1248(+)